MPRRFLRGISAKLQIAKRIREKQKELEKLKSLRAFQEQNRDSELKWLLELRGKKKNREKKGNSPLDVPNWFRATQEKLIETNRLIDRIEGQIRRLNALKK